MIPNGRIRRLLMACLLAAALSAPLRADPPPFPDDAESAAGVQTLQWEALPVQILEGEPQGDFCLDLRFSQTEFTVGEPVAVEITACFPGEIDDALLDLPVFADEAFEFEDPATEGEPAGDFLCIPLERGEALAERTCRIVDGKPHTTLSIRKTLVARSPGMFTIPESTLLIASPEEEAENVSSGDDSQERSSGAAGMRIVRSEAVTLTVFPVFEEAKTAGEAGGSPKVVSPDGREAGSSAEEETTVQKKPDAPDKEPPDTAVRTGTRCFPSEAVLLLVPLLSLPLLRRSRPEKAIHSEESRSDKAFAVFKRRIGLIRSSRFSDSRLYVLLLEALAGYGCDKLDLQGSIPGFPELEKLLAERGGDPVTLAALGDIFSRCEEVKRGRAPRPDRPLDALAAEAYRLVRDLDAVLALDAQSPRSST
ncbi:MAG: hypothetical protein LLF99_17760 [Desulfobacteraceae bacterium]|nr:hypothetical protein [Desulfobacteraceae bacterium]